MLRTMFALILGLYLFIIGLVTFVGLEAVDQSHEAARSTIVLCAQRDTADQNIREREHNIAQSKDLLQHPQKLGGIDPDLIRQGIKFQQQQLLFQIRNRRSYNVLHC